MSAAAKVFLLFTTLLLSIPCFAQNSLFLLREVGYENPTAWSLDRYGNLYVSDKDGNIKKYDENGDYQLIYSPQRQGEVNLLEAFNTIRVFAFYQNFQQYRLMDRFLGNVRDFHVDAEAIGFARIMTIAADNNLWIFDDTDFTLKKYDIQRRRVEQQTSFDLLLGNSDYVLTYMREYQNNLYISDLNSGILVFDNLGNYRKTLPFKGLTYFGFLEEELYFLSEGILHFFHLYDLQERVFPLPEGKEYIGMLATGKDYVFFHKDGFDIYRSLPAKKKEPIKD